MANRAGISRRTDRAWIDEGDRRPARHLALFGVVAAVTSTIALLVVNVLRATGDRGSFQWPGNLVAFIDIALLAAVSVVLRSLARRGGRRDGGGAHELGSYELIEKLGQGGMGEVWRAEHRLLVRPAAVKLVRPEMLGVDRVQDAGSVLRRFVREAQATAVLDSPTP